MNELEPNSGDDFDAALAQFEAVEPTAEPQAVKEAPDAATFREAGKRLGLSEESIAELLPPNLKTLEEVEAARQSLLGEAEYERDVNQQFADMIRDDMERIHQAREMSDIIDLRKELSEINPSFAAKSEREQMELLVGRAHTNAQVAQAWEDRYADPAGWQNAKDALASWVDTVSPYYDESATADRMAVADAVRSRGGGGRPVRQEPALGQMSDAEFNQHLADEYGIEA